MTRDTKFTPEPLVLRLELGERGVLTDRLGLGGELPVPEPQAPFAHADRLGRGRKGVTLLEIAVA